MKKIISFIMCGVILASMNVDVKANDITLNSKSAILMDTSGNIIFEKDADERYAPASVTKIMTMLLTMEALDSGKIKLDDTVVVSEYASSQGGTQVFLETNEQISVEDILKSIAVSSANDAAVAIAEHIAGTKEIFVNMMNEKAKALGMENTNFVNPTGLTEENHYTSARDIAIMSMELLKHDDIYNYTTIWMDSIRGGEFELSNTNKLLKRYDGLTGLKTGYTSEAMYCISATAKRGEEEFIAVSMGATSSDERSKDVTQMLDYAFANYSTYSPKINTILNDVLVERGEREYTEVYLEEKAEKYLINKNANVTYEIEMESLVKAPVYKDDIIGKITFYEGEKVLCELSVLAKEDVLEISMKSVFEQFIKFFFLKLG